MICYNKDCGFYRNDSNVSGHCLIISSDNLNFCKHYKPEPVKKDLVEIYVNSTYPHEVYREIERRLQELEKRDGN